MRLKIFIGFLILAVGACQKQQSEISNEAVENRLAQIAVSAPKTSKSPIEELAESFSDDSNVGLPQKNKIELSEFKKPDGYVVEIKFYSAAENKDWKLKQTFEFENPESLNYRPELKDFNNDGLKDFTYVSVYPARGANEIRRLFIYDRKKDELIYIKNSDEYPNLQYNKKLNCLDTWRFYGGYSTEFLQIDGDELKEFANVRTVDNNREIHLVDENGKEKLLRKDKMKADDGFIRYKNFDPPEPYEDDLPY